MKGLDWPHASRNVTRYFCPNLQGSVLVLRVPHCLHRNFVIIRLHYCSQTLQPHLAASSGPACTSGIPEPSHVLRALRLTPDRSDASIRFSFGRFTTAAEIEQAARLVSRTLASLASARPV